MASKHVEKNMKRGKILARFLGERAGL